MVHLSSHSDLWGRGIVVLYKWENHREVVAQGHITVSDWSVQSECCTTSENKGEYLHDIREGKDVSKHKNKKKPHKNKTITKKIDTEIKNFISLKETVKR